MTMCMILQFWKFYFLGFEADCGFMLWPFCNSFLGIVISTHVGLVQVPFIIGKALELLYVQYICKIQRVKKIDVICLSCFRISSGLPLP